MRDAVAFLAVGGEAAKVNRTTFLLLRIDLLVYLVFVVLDEGVRRLYDGLRRAVVTLQFEEPCVRIGTLKL